MQSAYCTRIFVFAICLLLGLSGAVWGAEEPSPDWTKADRQPPPTAAETRALMKRLLQYVHDHHLKTNDKSPQRGMVYEYFDTRRAGQFDQWVQGEALDTMHDGAWLAAALVNAYRATGDDAFKDFLVRWQLPFYAKMLNHSDRLFSAKHNDARPAAHRFDREHMLQEGEKGFVPYWWDDGASVSLERRRERNPLAPFVCTDRLAGKANPKFLLDGYSHGSSNHMAQDLGVMLELTWLLLREATDPAEKKLAAEMAEAAKNLHECRMRHHGHIPMCDAPAALAAGDAALMKHVPDQSAAAAATLVNHSYRALYDFKPGQRQAFPGFADDQEYRYYFGIARHGGKLPRPLAFKMIYDAYTEPLLYRYYSDDAAVPAGINRFDLHPYFAVDGRLTDYRSDRKGPGGKPRPIGSRMGPQNMACCGWALQALHAYPGIWEERYRREFAKDLRVYIDDRLPKSSLDPAPATTVQLGSAKLELLSTRNTLRVKGEVKGDAVTLKLFSRPDGKGHHAIVTLDRRDQVVNDRGEKIIIQMLKKTPAEGGFRFDLELPYGVVKGQKFWANGVEHGRYSVQAGDDRRNFYLLSPEKQVKARLEHELAGGLRTWEAIFKQRDYIPTGINAGADWEHFSDSGGYAHLLNAAAQWLFVLDGKSDWEQHRVPVLRDSPEPEA
ncbi:MAG TPA: hypothetical protein VN688_06910 [Gemmataceae bacterium]|nr:hypothetical protein [Gemmataceae bacterium]